MGVKTTAGSRTGVPADAAPRAASVDTERINAAPDLQYGGETFVAASEHFRSHHCSNRPAWIRIPCAAADLPGFRALIRELRGLPRVPVHLSNGESGRAIAYYLDKRRYSYRNNRLAQGVLLLPPTFSEYLRGRSKQALRTNIRAAAAEGIICAATQPAKFEETLDAWSGTGADLDELSRAYDGITAKVSAHSRWFAAWDADGRPMAVANLYIDTEWALLIGSSSVSRAATWLLHARVVEELYAGTTRNLCVTDGNALKQHPNLQYFQQRLGYRVIHMSPVHGPGADSSRRA